MTTAQHNTFTLTDDLYNSLPWEDLSGEAGELYAALAGSRIIGAETVDYPATDEIDLYLLDSIGRLFALRAGTDPADRKHRFYIQIAELPEASAIGNGI